jgi:EAL domain-containing protein (putative c-di-GMP-specific phosphodiesterase class I)
MYAAKGQAGNGYRVFGPDVILGGGERLRLENDLRRALVRGELEIVFQPQEDREGEVVGAEALLRWNHPELGPIRPNRFIPVAEESGLIQSIGLWVFEEVCSQLAAWRRDGVAVVPVSLNLSPVQFSQADLAETLERILVTHGVPASLLRLEVTESLLVKDVASTMALFGRLKALGLGLAVDDFGTGYSSLSYLQLLPIDELKIDQAFLRELSGPIDPGGRTAKLVQTMVTLGHDLGLVVVAEGVETPGQIEFLRRVGCDRLQGFGVSDPLSLSAFTELLASTCSAASARHAKIRRWERGPRTAASDGPWAACSPFWAGSCSGATGLPQPPSHSRSAGLSCFSRRCLPRSSPAPIASGSLSRGFWGASTRRSSSSSRSSSFSRPSASSCASPGATS